MVIHIQYKFHEISSIGNMYLVMAGDGKSLKVWQSKGNNSAITDDTPIKLHVHSITMVICIQYTFHDIPYISYICG